MSAAAVRVVVVDDQAIVREGLVTLLGMAEGIEVVGDAGTGRHALDLLVDLACDVVLMDLRMPDLDGVEATRRITRDHPDTAVLVLTTFVDDASVGAALAAGARGYLAKDAGRAEIAAAIRSAAAGQSTFDAEVSRRLVRALIDSGPTTAPDTGPNTGPNTGPPVGLTGREREVLGLVAQGMSNAAIAAELFIGQTTVKTHLNNAFAKIGASNRTEAVRWAYRTGLARP
jgi:DNA-binding NarL/FixJ family response regulator